MANERGPSIFDDRGSIGSEKELDEYGVWVKSESEESSFSERPEQDASFDMEFPPFEDERGSTGAEKQISETAKPQETGSDVSLSAALLLKIAEELATIKADLASLKSELDYLHREKAAPRPPEPVVQTIPAEAAETAKNNKVVVEAAFDDFGIEDAADEDAAYDEPANTGVFDADEDGGKITLYDEPANTGFFDADEDGGKITLTSDELDLLSEAAGETPEEMEDSFFADDGDQEKIVFTGDEMRNLLENTDISSREGAVEEAAWEMPDEPVDEPVEASFDDVTSLGESGDLTQEESLTEPETARKPAEEPTDEPVEASFDDETSFPESDDLTQKEFLTEPEAAREPVDEPIIEDETFDINIETTEEPLSEDSLVPEDADITLDEEPLTIEIDDAAPEAPDMTDDLNVEPAPDAADSVAGDDFGIGTDMTGDLGVEPAAEENDLIEPVPEAADIAFDPFGSLPDEDVVDEADTDEDPLVSGIAEDGDPFAEFPAAAETLAEQEPGEPAREAETDEYDPFADFPLSGEPLVEEEAGAPPPEEAAFTETFTADVTETEETPPPLPPGALIPPEALSEESFEPEEVVEADPELSRLMDEDIRPISPAPDDTSYLDDEKPLEVDTVAEPEPSASFEPPLPELPEEAAVPDDLARPEEAVLPEAIVPLPEEKPDTPEPVPADGESPALKGVPQEFKQELRTVLSYMDILLESLPEEKIEEFARSEHFEPYKKLFKELGLV